MPRKIRLNLTTMILCGVIAGTAWGLFLGPWGSWVKWIGDVYIGLLQMAVLPYVALTLMVHVGRLSTGQGSRLARVAGGVLLLLWGIGIGTLAIFMLAFPAWKTGSFFSTSLIEQPPSPDWMGVFIPSNPFWSLANNMVPAVVLFFIALGIAIMRVPNKEPLLEYLEVLIHALERLNRMMVRFAPIGVFGIIGNITGTLSIEQFGLLQGYVFVFAAAAIVVSLWIIPALIASCTSLSIRDILGALRDPLITAFVIGNTFVVLPMIVDAVRQLIQKTGIDRAAVQSRPEHFVQLAYPFPDIGRIITLIFIPFAAWFYGLHIAPSSYPKLLGIGVIGAFAKPIVMIPFLLRMARIPIDIFQLFLGVGIVVGRFGDLMKVMHLAAFAILTTHVLSKTIRIRVPRLAVASVVTVFLLVVSVVGIRVFLANSFEASHSKTHLIVERPLLGTPVAATFSNSAHAPPIQLKQGEDRLTQIHRREVIRIGIAQNKLPFCYRNPKGDLVGFDIDMAHQLARDLRVRIEFVPVGDNVVAALHAGRYDIAMAGLEGNLQRFTQLPEMDPYLVVTRALVVPDYLRDHFRSLAALRSQWDNAAIKLAVVDARDGNKVTDPRMRLGTGWGAIVRNGLADRIEIVHLRTESEFFKAWPPVADALVTSAEEGSAWTLKYPRFSVVKPDEIDTRIGLYYFVAHHGQLADFINSWLRMKRQDGTVQQLYDYWILGRDPNGKPPRWCVLRNVLHWVD